MLTGTGALFFGWRTLPVLTADCKVCYPTINYLIYIT